MKDIPGYEGQYGITKDGKVWSYFWSRYIAQNKNKKGYCRVNLRKSKKERRSLLVHRLVALTYLGDITDKEVDHINRIRDDNRTENLQILTKEEHIEKDRECFKKGGLKLKGIPRAEDVKKKISLSHKVSKKCHQSRENLRDQKIFMFFNSQKEISFIGRRSDFHRIYNLNSGSVHRLITGKCKQVKGWILCQN